MGRSASVRVLLFLVLVAAFDAGTSDAGTEEAERLYSHGRELLASGDHGLAEQAFARAIAENPYHAEATLQLAKIRSRNILTYEKAEDLLLSIPEIAGKIGGKGRDDLLFRAGVSMGKLFVKSGRSSQAIPILRNVIASAPAGSPLDEAYATLGLAHYYERSYEDAIFEMRKAIKLNPNNADAKFNLKTIRSRLEHFQAGKLFSRLADRKRAIDAFRKAIDLDPRFVEARHRLGVELYLSGDVPDALKELQRAALVSAEYGKAHEIRYAEGLALSRLSRPEEALASFDQAVRSRPSFAPAHNEMGKLLMQREEYDAAIEHFVKAIGADPKAEYARGLQSAMNRKAKKAGAVTR